MKRWINDALVYLGGLILCGGVYMIYPPLAFILFGVFLIVIGVERQLERRKQP
jgi:hypothetical protein